MSNPPMLRLDNPAWHSLNEIHRSFALGNDLLKRYDPEISPFGGINTEEDVSNILNGCVSPGESMYIIATKPPLPPGFEIEKELICLQMVCPDIITMDTTEHITLLTDAYNDAVKDLVNLVQPGYFRAKTKTMGEYFGIYQNDMLVAVTGERMRMNGFTEVSAVVTHPDFTGKGYAKQLVAHTVNKNLADNIIPYLHVTEDNAPAIRLYEKLGFQTRRKISFWKIKRAI